MESFFQIVTVDKISISQRSLRDRKGSRSILSIFQKFTHTHIKLHKTEKRALSDTSSRKPHRASMTVEAIFVLPIFLFCMMMRTSLIRVTCLLLRWNRLILIKCRTTL